MAAVGASDRCSLITVVMRGVAVGVWLFGAVVIVFLWDLEVVGVQNYARSIQDHDRRLFDHLLELF